MFAALSAIVDKIEESDWVIIAGEWSRKFLDILGVMTISQSSLNFFDGCKNSKNERLISWGQANTLTLLISLDSADVELNIDIFNPVNLQKAEEVVKTCSYFSKRTTSYETTLLALGFLRHQLTSFAIRETKVTKVILLF